MVPFGSTRNSRVGPTDDGRPRPRLTAGWGHRHEPGTGQPPSGPNGSRREPLARARWCSGDRRDGPLPCAHEFIEHGARPSAELPDQCDRELGNALDQNMECRGGHHPHDHGGLRDHRHRMQRTIEGFGTADHGAGSEHQCAVSGRIGSSVPVEHDGDLGGDRARRHDDLACCDPSFHARRRHSRQVSCGTPAKQGNRSQLSLGQVAGKFSNGPCAPGRCHANIRQHRN